jgi:transposase
MSADVRCGPENCPLTAWTALSPSDRKLQRQPLARKLQEQGFTPEQIATQFGVSIPTIYRDLDISHGDKCRDRGTDTLGRKKSTGRPRSETNQRAIDLHKEGETTASIAKQTGLGERRVGLIREQERAREEGIQQGRKEAEINPALLSLTAQEKLDAAIRQHKKKLDMEFELRVRGELKRHLDMVSLPSYLKEIASLERSIRDRRGIMDRATYRKILACLHPDRQPDPMLKKRYEEAFRLFTELEKRVLNEKESPTQFRNMPRTYDELMRMKEKVRQERAARRAAKKDLTVQQGVRQ